RRLDRWTAGAAINLDPEMSQLSLEITGETLFGVDLRDQAAWLGETAEVLRETFIREFLALVPLPDWLPLPSHRRKRPPTPCRDHPRPARGRGGQGRPALDAAAGRR